MPRNTDIAVRISGDASDLQGATRDGRRAIDDFARSGAGATAALRDIDRHSHSAARGIEGLGRGAVTAARAIGAFAGVAVGGLLIGGLKAAVREAAEAEQANARLGATLRATGHAAGLTARQLHDVAESLAESTRFDADEIKNAAAVLLTFRAVGGEAFGETLQAAADLAELMQTDLQSAVLQLGKALEDPVNGLTALRRVGVSFTEEQQEAIKALVETGRQAEAMNRILQTLRAQGIAGVSQEINQGMTKNLVDARKSWDDFLESIGRSRLVAGSVDLLADAVRGLDRAVDAAGNIAGFLYGKNPSYEFGDDPEAERALARQFERERDERKRARVGRQSYEAEQRFGNVILDPRDPAAQRARDRTLRNLQERPPPDLTPAVRSGGGGGRRALDDSYERGALRSELELSRETLRNEQRARDAAMREEQATYDEALALHGERMQEIAAIYLETRTPLERLNAEMARLDELAASGAIDPDTYGRRVAQLKEQFGEVAEAAKETGNALSEFARQAGYEAESFTRSGFLAVMRGEIESLPALFKSAIDRMVADYLTSQLATSLGGANGFGGFLQSLFGGFGGSAAAPAGGTPPFVPQLAVGSDYVPRTGMYMLHRGEKVQRSGDRFGRAPPAINLTINVPAGTSRDSAAQVARQTGRAVQTALARFG